MKKLLFALGVALWLCAPAHAQVASAYTVSACGAQSNPAGQPFPLTMDLTGNLCITPSNTSAAPLYVAPAPYPYTPLTPGQHNVAITGSTALTVPTTATYATICASTAVVKYTTDGTTTPTASVGQPLAVGGCVGLSGATVLANFRAISATGTLDVEYFK